MHSFCGLRDGHATEKQGIADGVSSNSLFFKKFENSIFENAGMRRYAGCVAEVS